MTVGAEGTTPASSREGDVAAPGKGAFDRRDASRREAPERRYAFARIGVRVAVVLGLVFLPIAALMIGLATLNYREDVRNRLVALLAHVERAQERREANVAKSALMARSLLDASLTVGPERCAARLQALGARSVWYDAVLLDGLRRTDCAYVAPDARRRNAPAMTVIHSVEGARVQARVRIEDPAPPAGLGATRTAGVIDGTRAVDRSLAYRPVEWPDAEGPLVFEERDARSGDAIYFALGAAGPFGASVLAAAPAAAVRAEPLSRLLTTIGLVTTVLVLGTAAAWLAIERVVLRRLRKVQAAAAHLAAGELSTRVALDDDAPIELSALGTQLDAMAERIEARTEDAETAVAEQSRLLRELHHRVKNNFQVISSLLSLQRRNSPPEASEVLRYPEDRVAAMATAYRVSYAEGDIGDVPLTLFVEELTSAVMRSAGLPRKALEGEVHVEGASIDLDGGVALGLLLTELMTPLCRAAGAVDAPLRLDMLAGVSGLNILLVGPVTEDEEAGSLPERFTAAFLNQIDGVMETSVDDVMRRARIRVPVGRLRFANARSA